MEKEILTIDDIIKDYEDKGIEVRSKVDFLNKIKDILNLRIVTLDESDEEGKKNISELKNLLKNKNWCYCPNLESSITPIYAPKKYLKWEDLIFTDDKQEIKVKLNDEDYTVVYFKTVTYYSRKGYEYVAILKNNDLVIYSISGDSNFIYHYKKFFNALHLEVVE